MTATERILAIDVGAGTQDILLWESGRTYENCEQLILPSQTQIVAARIRRATALGRPVHLVGTVMGGGASTDAVTAHIAAGLAVTATAAAAKTLHDNPRRVEALGVRIAEGQPADAEAIDLADIDPEAIGRALALFGVELPERFAVAVFDHGESLELSNRRFRFQHLERLIAAGGDLGLMVYDDDLPPYLTRMAAVRARVGGTVMDTGAAGIWGALEDPRVAEQAERGAIIVNIGNMHTFAVLLRGRRMLGLFEHHTHLLTTARLADLVAQLRAATISFEEIFAEDGHGATVHPDYRPAAGTFDFVAVTGPNRGLARPLGWYEAVPHGDMMLAGSFGLIAAARDKRARQATAPPGR